MAPSRQGARKPGTPRSARVRDAERDDATDTSSGQPGNGRPGANGSPSGNGKASGNGAVGTGQRDTEGNGRGEPGRDVPADTTVADGVPALPADGIGTPRTPKPKESGPQAKLASATGTGTSTGTGAPGVSGPSAPAPSGTSPAAAGRTGTLPETPSAGARPAADPKPSANLTSYASPKPSASSPAPVSPSSAGDAPTAVNSLPSRPKPSPIPSSGSTPESAPSARPAAERSAPVTPERATSDRPASEPSLSPASFAWQMADAPADSPASPARNFLRRDQATTASPPPPTKTESPAATGPGRASRPAATVQSAPPKQDKPKKARKADARSARQAHLTVARVEPWSVMKFSFVVSLVAFVILFVAVSILYGALSGLGVFDSLQRVVSSVTSSQSSAGVNAKAWFSASKVLGYTALLGSLNIVLITAMSTIGAVVYNLTSRLVGGVEVTLRETE